MKCPYCKDEMSSGLLNGRGPGAFFWMPESEKLPIFFQRKLWKRKMLLYLTELHMVVLSIQRMYVIIVKRLFLNLNKTLAVHNLYYVA
jgi:hypothetical protein